MKLRFVNKSKHPTPPSVVVSSKSQKEDEEKKVVLSTKQGKNKKSKKSDNMDIKEQLEAAEAAVNSFAPEVKVVKADRGLIERTESSKIILTEDNRQVLND